MIISDVISQTKNCTDKLINTIPFIVYNRLWDGFFKHKLVLTVSVISAVLIPWSIIDLLSALPSENMSNGNLTLGIASEGNFNILNRIFEGTNQNLIMILINMLNVYFSNKTIERLSGTKIEMRIQDMIQSQIRNFIVVIRNWFFELMIGVAISVVIGIFGPDWMVEVLKFVVSGFFIGYLFLDTYNNTFGVSIKESSVIIQRHLGAAITIGLVAKILLFIPLVGALFMSFICGVASTWYMHTSAETHPSQEAYVYN